MYTAFWLNFPCYFDLKNLHEHSVSLVAHSGIFLSEMRFEFLCCSVKQVLIVLCVTLLVVLCVTLGTRKVLEGNVPCILFVREFKHKFW
jgi:hypothetical protein